MSDLSRMSILFSLVGKTIRPVAEQHLPPSVGTSVTLVQVCPSAGKEYASGRTAQNIPARGSNRTPVSLDCPARRTGKEGCRSSVSLRQDGGLYRPLLLS